jgi:hypothetical protein
VQEGPTAEAVEATERWFVKRGLPHFIFRYSASRDVLTRAVPLLSLLFLAEVIGNAPNSDYRLWQDLLAILAAISFVLVVWIVDNRLARRHAFSRPTDVAALELAVFVVGPALVPLAFGGQWRSALVTAGANLGLVAAIYLATSYGVIPISRWALERGARQIFSVVGVLVRALPLLLLVVIVVFVNTEAWQVASDLQWTALVIVIALFFVLATMFATIRVPRQIGELTQEPWSIVRTRVEGTPAPALLPLLGAAEPDPPGLSRREWGNVGLVVLISETILVWLVAAFMFVFFVVFGVLAISAEVAETWIGHAPDTIATFRLFDQQMVLTGELLKVSGFLAGFCGLYFTVSVLSDATYQEEFLSSLLDEVRQAFAVRAVYLRTMISAVASTREP